MKPSKDAPYLHSSSLRESSLGHMELPEIELVSDAQRLLPQHLHSTHVAVVLQWRAAKDNANDHICCFSTNAFSRRSRSSERGFLVSFFVSIILLFFSPFALQRTAISLVCLIQHLNVLNSVLHTRDASGSDRFDAR